MCAMFRGRKPVEANGRHADLRPRGVDADAALRPTVWGNFIGLQAGRSWKILWIRSVAALPPGIRAPSFRRFKRVVQLDRGRRA